MPRDGHTALYRPSRRSQQANEANTTTHKVGAGRQRGADGSSGQKWPRGKELAAHFVSDVMGRLLVFLGITSCSLPAAEVRKLDAAARRSLGVSRDDAAEKSREGSCEAVGQDKGFRRERDRRGTDEAAAAGNEWHSQFLNRTNESLRQPLYGMRSRQTPAAPPAAQGAKP